MNTVWLLVHQSTTAADEISTSKTIGFFDSREKAERAILDLRRFESYRNDMIGFRIYELIIDREIDRAQSDSIIFGANL